MSWGIVDSTVLRVTRGGTDYVVKAVGPGNHHLSRELRAHKEAAGHLGDRVAPLVAASEEHRIMVLEYLPGELAERTGAERDPAIMVQAGQFLSVLHGIGRSTDETIEANMTDAGLRWLDKPHRISPDQVRRAREILEGYAAPAVTVSACHGDFSGRNWVVDDGYLRVIDFGRFGYRPPVTDLLRLHYRTWIEEPSLRDAFMEGYGPGRDWDQEQWAVSFLREAVSTAAWAHKVGDRAFESEGLSLVETALASFDSAVS